MVGLVVGRSGLENMIRLGFRFRVRLRVRLRLRLEVRVIRVSLGSDSVRGRVGVRTARPNKTRQERPSTLSHPLMS